MWLADLVVVAAESTPPPADPPTVPYDTIGLVLVAVVGAISAIVVAMVQRGNKTTPSAPPPTGPTASSFSISENEWITVRDRSIATSGAVDNLRTEFGYHERISEDHINRMNRDVQEIKRRLGI